MNSSPVLLVNLKSSFQSTCADLPITGSTLIDAGCFLLSLFSLTKFFIVS